MEFVFTPWYFVMIALVVGIALSIFFFIKMDRKDRVLIEKFIKESQSESEVNAEDNSPVVNNENKTE